MKTYYYYKGDWKVGKILVDTIKADTITDADAIFKQKHGIDVKDRTITTTMQKLEV